MRWGALVSALLCSACATGPSAPVPVPQSVADISIEIRHRLPTVKVLISGEPFELFLDLAGHRAIALTPSELSRAKVKYLPHSDKFQNSYGQILESRRLPRVCSWAISRWGMLRAGSRFSGILRRPIETDTSECQFSAAIS